MVEKIILTEFQEEILYVLEDMKGRIVNELVIRMIMGAKRSIKPSLDSMERKGLIKSKLVKALDSEEKEKIYSLTKLSKELLELI